MVILHYQLRPDGILHTVPFEPSDKHICFDCSVQRLLINSNQCSPLSFNHKLQQMYERKRTKKQEGSRCGEAGILAISRAFRKNPLKYLWLVIAEPDILTFDLADHKPQFLILASDGLWDTFSNEEAVSFIKERLEEPHFGAKSITLQSYYRGSLDNITVIVINLSDHVWSNATITKKYN